MKLTKLKDLLTLLTLSAFGLIYLFAFLGSLNNNGVLETIATSFGIAFLILLPIRIVVGLIITVIEKRWGYLIFKATILVIAGYFLTEVVQYFNDALLKAQVQYGTARISYEVLELDNDIDNFDDSLVNDISVKTVLKNFDIVELQSDSGSALRFTRKEGVHYYRNLCIDCDGNIRSYRLDTINTYGDCIELRITDSVERFDSTLIFSEKL